MDVKDERFDKLIEEGHAATWDQDWDLAIDCYQKALEINQEKASLWVALGYAYSALERSEDALKAYSNAMKLDPKDPIPAERMAQIAMQMGFAAQAASFSIRAGELHLKNHNLQKAIENWSFAEKCNPKDLQPHTLLAKVYEKTNQLDQAAKELIILAALAQQQGDLDKVEEGLSHAEQLCPENIEVQKARSIFTSGKTISVPSPEKNPPPSIKPIQSGTRKRNLERDTDLVGKAHQTALSQMAEGFFEGNDSNENGVEPKKTLSSWMNGAKGIFNRQVDLTKIKQSVGNYLEKMKDNDLEHAIQDLEDAIQAGLNHPAAQFELGYGYYRQGKYELVEKALTPLLKESDYQISSYLLIGDSFFKKEKNLEAAKAFYLALMRTDLMLYPKDRQKELEKAYAPYLDTLNHPQDEESLRKICNEIGNILFSRDWKKRIKQIREQLNAQHPQEEGLPIGSLFAESGGLNAVTIMSSIQTLAKEGKQRTATEELLYTLQFMPTYLPLHILLGDLLLEQGQTEDAFNKFYIVAKTYEIRGEKEKALEIYRRLTDMSPMNTVVRQKLIDLLSETGNVNECFQEHLDLAEAFYTLADLRQARETYQKAYQYVLDNHLGEKMQVMVLHLIGDLDIQNLDWKLARDLYQQIRQLDPNDEKARILSIELSYRLHDKVQALKELDTYLDYLEQNNKLAHAQDFMKQFELDYPDWKDLNTRTMRLANKRQ